MKPLETVRRIVGARQKITQVEMATILLALCQEGLNLRNGFVQGTMSGDPQTTSAAWAGLCRGNTCISIVDGRVRYDEPGSMHPLMYADVIFAPEGLPGAPYKFLRQHARRVLIVTQEPLREPLPEPQMEVLICDEGHRWSTPDPDRDWQCPECGGPWV